MANEGKIAGTITRALIGQVIGRKYCSMYGAIAGLPVGHIIDFIAESA